MVNIFRYTRPFNEMKQWSMLKFALRPSIKIDNLFAEENRALNWDLYIEAKNQNLIINEFAYN